MTQQKVISLYLRISSLILCAVFSYLGVYITLLIWHDMTVDRRSLWMAIEQITAIVVATVLLKNKIRKFICNHILAFFIASFLFYISTIWLVFVDPYYRVLCSIIDYGILLNFISVHSMEVREIIYTKRRHRIRFNIDIERCEGVGFVIGAFMAPLFPISDLWVYVYLSLTFISIDFICSLWYFRYLDRFMTANNLTYSGGDEEEEEDGEKDDDIGLVSEIIRGIKSLGKKDARS